VWIASVEKKIEATQSHTQLRSPNFLPAASMMMRLPICSTTFAHSQTNRGRDVLVRIHLEELRLLQFVLVYSDRLFILHLSSRCRTGAVSRSAPISLSSKPLAQIQITVCSIEGTAQSPVQSLLHLFANLIPNLSPLRLWNRAPSHLLPASERAAHRQGSGTL